jgi:hypothetical protein
MLLTKESLQANKPERVYKEIQLPPPNPSISAEPVTVRIRSMFGSEYLDLIDSTSDANGTPIEFRRKHLGELMVAWCWVDADGKRVLEDADINTAWWRRQHMAFTVDFVAAVRKHNGAGVFDNVDASKKNSEETTDSECSIALPPDLAIQPPEIVSTL